MMRNAEDVAWLIEEDVAFRNKDQIFEQKRLREILKNFESEIRKDQDKITAGLINECLDRVEDMYRSDDGQAWKEAKKFLATHGRTKYL